MPKPFKGTIKLDVRDSVAGLGRVSAGRGARGRAERAVVLYDDTGLAAWSPYGGRIEMPTLQRLADNGLTYSQWHTTALCSPTRSTFLTGRNHHQNGFASISEAATGFPGYSSHIPPENGTIAARAARRGLEHVLGRQEPQHPGRRRGRRAPRRRSGRSRRATTASTASSAARPTSGIPTWPRTTTTSTSRTCPRTATTSPRTSPTRRCGSSATPSSPSPTSRGTCGSARAPTTRRTTRRRSTSTSTRASSTTATRPTASGCCRG